MNLSEILAHDPVPDDLAGAVHRAAPRLGSLAVSLVYFASAPSTNDAAARLAAAGAPEGTVVVADHQTAGRGRRGHEWFSPAGSGLYVSVLLAPARAVRDPDRATQLLTMTAGLALAESVEEQTGLRADIKWPNDLYVGPRKLAGILAEGVVPDGASDPATRMTVVLGYGINVRAVAYPGALRNRATSLDAELGRSIDRADLLAATLAGLAARYDDLLRARYDVILDAWRSRARGLHGAAVEWDALTACRSGVTCGIDREGALLVSTPHGVERIVSGEVRWGCF